MTRPRGIICIGGPLDGERKPARARKLQTPTDIYERERVHFVKYGDVWYVDYWRHEGFSTDEADKLAMEIEGALT